VPAWAKCLAVRRIRQVWDLIPGHDRWTLVVASLLGVLASGCAIGGLAILARLVNVVQLEIDQHSGELSHHRLLFVAGSCLLCYRQY
jgi:hypothetical protein